MNICEAALAVAKRHWIYVVLYLVGLSLIMTVMLFQMVSGGTGSKPEFTPWTSRVAVVDRDGGAGGIADGLRDYLKQTNTVVQVKDGRRSLQDAMATEDTDVIYVVPKGYMRDFAKASLEGRAPQRLDVILKPQGDQGDLSETKVTTFLSNLRTAYLADSASTSSSAVSARESDGKTDGTGHAGEAGDAEAMRLAVDAVVQAGDASQADAHVAVVATRHASGSASASLVFGRSLTLGSYPIVTSMVIVIAMVVGAFTVESMRRRMEVSAVGSRQAGLGVLAACAVIGLLVVLYYLLLSLGVTLMATGSLKGLALRPVALATCSLAVYVCFAISIGFVLGRLAVSPRAANGLANVVGLVIAFTSGAWSFGSSVMTGPVATIGKLLCGRWYIDSIDRAMGLGAYAAGSFDPAGWFVSTGIVALFAIALACVGLAVGSPRRHIADQAG